MTPLHTRNKAYRNLYRAKPLVKHEQHISTWEAETKRMVNAAYKEFWKKRKVKAPWVSRHQLGAMDPLPNEK